jgi:hypothetical protein
MFQGNKKFWSRLRDGKFTMKPAYITVHGSIHDLGINPHPEKETSKVLIVEDVCQLIASDIDKPVFFAPENGLFRTAINERIKKVRDIPEKKFKKEETLALVNAIESLYKGDKKDEKH